MKIILSFLMVCSGTVIYGQAPDHKVFSELLTKYVSKDGKVNYTGFIDDRELFQRYLNSLSQNPPTKSWTANQRKAYWINAYNAFTIKLIVDNYPVKSIKDLGGWIYKVNTAWDIRFIKIGTETLDLNNIEHEKLRREFDDPRIHFAIVCASKSCPKLMNEAYVAEKLEEQLDQAGRSFLNDPSRNKISRNNVELSSIFKWYKGDFTKKTTLIEFVNRFTTQKISRDAAIGYLDYDWSLNE
ncbi:MAG TPA: DUF547 domain-containing protein [Cyclobacteriaceae bacterium]|nr:DUF547 domain-containing protein [Cyclobacteriaceae bacterium]